MPLQNNWKFPGLAKVYNDQSALAHHVVFETGVVKPLVDALRSRMKNAAAAGPNDLLSGALVGLMQVEADVQARAGHGGAAKPVLDATGAQNFIATDLMYLTQTNPFMVDSNLVATMVWTYENPASPQAAWPPQWISENINRTNHLEGYPTIQAGLETFIATATNSIHSQVAIPDQITNLIGALDRFKAGENALFDAASGRTAPRPGTRPTPWPVSRNTLQTGGRHRQQCPVQGDIAGDLPKSAQQGPNRRHRQI